MLTPGRSLWPAPLPCLPRGGHADPVHLPAVGRVRLTTSRRSRNSLATHSAPDWLSANTGAGFGGGFVAGCPYGAGVRWDHPGNAVRSCPERRSRPSPGLVEDESHLVAWLAFTTWATGVWIFLLLVAFVALIISTLVAGRRAARTSARWSPRAESRRGGPGCADSNLSLDRG